MNTLLNQQPPDVLDITREKRSIIPRDQWPDLTIDDLISQKNILYDRWEFLQSKGNIGAKQFVEAIEKIEELIQNKLNQNDIYYF
jgi:hypothetical protein